MPESTWNLVEIRHGTVIKPVELLLSQLYYSIPNIEMKMHYNNKLLLNPDATPTSLKGA